MDARQLACQRLDVDARHRRCDALASHTEHIFGDVNVGDVLRVGIFLEGLHLGIGGEAAQSHHQAKKNLNHCLFHIVLIP